MTGFFGKHNAKVDDKGRLVIPSGVKSVVPFDEVVQAMYEVGIALPATLRETALGGLAAAPSACSGCGGCA